MRTLPTISEHNPETAPNPADAYADGEVAMARRKLKIDYALACERLAVMASNQNLSLSQFLSVFNTLEKASGVGVQAPLSNAEGVTIVINIPQLGNDTREAAVFDAVPDSGKLFSVDLGSPGSPTDDSDAVPELVEGDDEGDDDGDDEGDDEGDDLPWS